MLTYYQRNLPHWQPPSRDVFITWRLKGSLPQHIQGIPNKSEAGKRFLTLDRELDQAPGGPHRLQNPKVAGCVVERLKNMRNQNLMRLHAFVVMPNHMHILITPIVALAEITCKLKGATARRANLLLGLTGNTFWQAESFDHWVRNAGEWQKIRSYIERNPVAAGLVATPEEWPWSSASWPLE
jgi:putative transposase